jgi:hypothetical protein
MTQTLFKTLAPAFLGAVALSSTFLMPQAAQAGKIWSSGTVNFSGITLTKNNVANLFPGSALIVSTNANYFQDNILISNDTDTSGQVILGPGTPALVTVTSTAATPPPSLSTASSTIGTANSQVTSALLKSDIQLLIGDPIESANTTSNEQVFSANFSANANDIIDFKAALATNLFVKVEGFDTGDFKSATAQFNASYTITQLRPQSEGGNLIVFQGPTFDNSIQLIGQNGEETAELNVPVIDLPFTVLTTGNYRLAFNTNLTLSGTNHNPGTTVPEPSAVLGLAGVALVGVLARKRRLG